MGGGECYKRKSMMCLQVRERSADSKNIKHTWLLKDKGAVVGEEVAGLSSFMGWKKGIAPR